jgi:cytidylate kinase
VKLEDAPAVERVVRECSIELVAGPGGRPVVTLDGEDVSDAIRRADVTALSSPVSALPGVRRILVAKQQALASDRDVVMEGRDIGTVVLPDAEVKVFLTATIEERARRRAGELASRGESADASAIAAGIAERDARDSSRAESPLCQAPGCTVIVSDDMGIAEVVERVVALTRGVARTRRTSRR